MIQFAWPWVFTLLPLPWLAARLLPPARTSGAAALRLPFFRELPGNRETGGRGAGAVVRVLAWLAWLLLAAAAARPQWLGDPLQLPVSGRDLMLAVDVSGSMEQEDYALAGRAVSRLDLVKAVAGRFIERRAGDRLGLILFGTRAYVQTPLTHDRKTVRAFLDDSVIGLAGRETAIGDAVALAVKRLRRQPEDNRVLILLTDGANTAGNIAPLEAAEVAAQSGIRIYTVGIGGGQLGVQGPFGMRLLRPGGDLDPGTLKAIAEATGGRYFHATDSAELERVYAELDRLEPSVRDNRSFRPMHALYHWPAALALALSIIAAAVRLPMRRPARTPHAEVPGGSA